MATRKHIRTSILTISSIAITVTGAWYGLGLKTQQEIKEVYFPPNKPNHTHTHTPNYFFYFLFCSVFPSPSPRPSPYTIAFSYATPSFEPNRKREGGDTFFFRFA